jgi:succinate dehydrogenase / fumarate reductase iron-sulfur subunit
MKILLSILRFQPEKAADPYSQEFEVEAEPQTRLLDLLVHIQRRVDPSLSFRRSCGHGVCGSDAMVVNGSERLACRTLVKDVAAKEGDRITIAPLRSLPVLRDLIVDQRRFFENYRSVRPYLVEDEANPPAAGRERLQAPAEREKIDEATNCILCLACYSACPVIREKNPRFLGPAAIVQAYRFQEDSRDRGFEQRLEALDRPDGVWPCETRMECTRVCPRGIKVTKLINLTKRRITAFRAEGGKKS